MSIGKQSVRAMAIIAVCVGALSLTAAAFAGNRADDETTGAIVKGAFGLGAIRTAPPFSMTAAEKFGTYEQLPGARVAAIATVRVRAMTPVPVPVAPKRTVATASRKPAAPRKAPAPKVAAGGWRTARVTWYGPGFYGHRMAGGGTLTPTSMVVAHRSMPFGTKIQFSYKGRTCVAVVQDRGPSSKSLEFDLGPGTAAALKFGGVGNVQWRIVK